MSTTRDPEDPMGTGVTQTPAYAAWKAAQVTLIRTRYPGLADAVIDGVPWLEGFDDRAHRTPNDMADWLVGARCAELGINVPVPIGD